MIIDSGIVTGSLQVIGNAEVTGSLEVTSGITGSLLGTSSYALTASYLEGYISPFPFTGSALISGSLEITGSTASSQGFIGALQGNADTATSSSYALSASYALNTPIATSASYATSASSIPYSGLTGEVPTWNQNTTGTAATASYVQNAVSASYALNATNAINATSSSYAVSASYALNSTNASAASTATSASYALNSTNAVSATSATSASYALNATNSTSATTATSASYALNSTNAVNATSATSATSASYALNATNAVNADTVDGQHASAFVPNSATSSFATQTYVNTAVSNLVDSAPGTLDTLNELAAALGDDPNFATTVATSIGTKQAQLNGTGFVKASGTTISYDNSTYTPTSRTLTINGTGYDLSADRTWTISSVASASSVPYSGLTGTVPTWNQNTSGNASTATSASYAATSTSASYALNAVPTSGYTFGTTFSLGSMYVGTGYQGSGLTSILGAYSNGYAYQFGAAAVQSFLGLGSNAYTSTAYAPLTGTGASGNWSINAATATSASYATTSTSATTATQTTAAVTFNDGGAGVGAGTSFNGSTARTVSYNSIGAPSTGGANASGTWGINVTGYSTQLNGYSNQSEATILTGPANGPVWKVRYDSATANRYIDFGFKDGNGVFSTGLKIYNGDTPTWQGSTLLHASNYSSYAVPTSRTITINGTALDLSADRSFTVTASETDTLSSVTGRGATTSTFSTFSGGALIGNMNISKSPYTDTIENKTSGGVVWLNYSHNGNVGLGYGGGNVGVGVISSPTRLFHVYKDSDVWHTAIGGASGELRIGGQNGSGAVIQSYTPAGSVRDLYIQRDGGNVAIGASSATYKLQVIGGQYGTYLKGGDLGTGSDILRVVDASNNTKYLARGDGKHFFTGDTDVQGLFTATVKSFVIDHPTKEGKKLQYGVLEGPEHSVYVRGKLTKENTIILPDHWHALVHEDTITVNLTSIGKKQDLWVEEVNAHEIKIGSKSEINCFYTVFAERKDIEKLVTEFDIEQ